MKGIKLFVLGIFFSSFLGCATVKGTVTGMAEDTQSAGKGIAAAFDGLMKADQWFRDNWW